MIWQILELNLRNPKKSHCSFKARHWPFSLKKKLVITIVLLTRSSKIFLCRIVFIQLRTDWRIIGEPIRGSLVWSSTENKLLSFPECKDPVTEVKQEKCNMCRVRVCENLVKTKVCAEGHCCECRDGLLFNGTECVEKNDCPCFDKRTNKTMQVREYIPIGSLRSG